MSQHFPIAPPLVVSQWFNTQQPITLDSLRGRVVALHTFQMLCPGCVTHGLPQAVRLSNTFDAKELRVIGLHTVFEHHEVMTAAALKVFIHEYRLSFPIGIDQPDPATGLPLTMQAYGLQGTPSLVLLDKTGRVRLHQLGQLDDLLVGAMIGRLLQEGAERTRTVLGS